MKIMWFTNIPMPAVDRYLGSTTVGSGHWLSSLLEALQGQGGLQLAVVTALPGHVDTHFSADGIDYFVVGQPRGTSHLAVREADVQRCAALVAEWQPDLVHIHGTERFFGLLGARRLIDLPTLITLQGVLATVVAHFFGSLTPWQIVRATRWLELPIGYGLLWDWWRYKRVLSREREILRGVRYYTGQTEWDRAQVWAHHPAASYWRIGRVLRAPFYERRWALDGCERHTIVFTNAGLPLRDVESLLRAVSWLRLEFPNVRLRLAGRISERSGYGRFVRHTIRALGLEDAVELLGYISAEQMAEVLISSHVFAIASHVENESNSLCEAMLVGMPCIASYAGGLPSMIEHERTGLFFPPGDAEQLGLALRKLFQNDTLAQSLATAAHEAAARRHDPERVVEDLQQVYLDVLGQTAMVADDPQGGECAN